MFFIKLSTKTYLPGVCYDQNNTEGVNGIYFCNLHVSLKYPFVWGYKFIEFVLLILNLFKKLE